MTGANQLSAAVKEKLKHYMHSQLARSMQHQQRKVQLQTQHWLLEDMRIALSLTVGNRACPEQDTCHVHKRRHHLWAQVPQKHLPPWVDIVCQVLQSKR